MLLYLEEFGDGSDKIWLSRVWNVSTCWVCFDVFVEADIGVDVVAINGGLVLGLSLKYVNKIRKEELIG